jgi:hypothetical protein
MGGHYKHDRLRYAAIWHRESKRYADRSTYTYQVSHPDTPTNSSRRANCASTNQCSDCSIADVITALVILGSATKVMGRKRLSSRWYRHDHAKISSALILFGSRVTLIINVITETSQWDSSGWYTHSRIALNKTRYELDLWATHTRKHLVPFATNALIQHKMDLLRFWRVCKTDRYAYHIWENTPTRKHRVQCKLGLPPKAISFGLDILTRLYWFWSGIR